MRAVKVANATPTPTEPIYVQTNNADKYEVGVDNTLF